MSERFQTDNRELDDLFERYRAAPDSHVFAPLADACRKAGMLDEALEICAKGVARNPRYASGHVVLGKCHYDSGRAGEAQASFEHVLELDPKNLVALKYLGIIHAERGDMAHAREYFEHILAMDPGDREIRSRIEDVSQRPAVGRSTRVPPAVAPVPPAVVTPPPPAPVAPPVAEQPVPAAAPAAKADEDEPVLLPDVADEEFRGEPITLRDESVTPDEIATITLADIYASQGYTTRALRIYREVHRRQPANAALAAKIEALEKQEAASKPAPRPAPTKPEPAKKTDPPRTTAPSRPRAAEPAPPIATGGATPGTHPIDQARSYEHFKRWIKASR